MRGYRYHDKILSIQTEGDDSLPTVVPFDVHYCRRRNRNRNPSFSSQKALFVGPVMPNVNPLPIRLSNLPEMIRMETILQISFYDNLFEGIFLDEL